MVDKKLIEILCASIRVYLKELKEAKDIDWNKFLKDNRSRTQAFLFTLRFISVAKKGKRGYL